MFVFIGEGIRSSINELEIPLSVWVYLVQSNPENVCPLKTLMPGYTNLAEFEKDSHREFLLCLQGGQFFFLHETSDTFLNKYFPNLYPSYLYSYIFSLILWKTLTISLHTLKRSYEEEP